MSMSFNPDDTVQLKSGGPIMTVAKVLPPTQYEPDPRVVCIWFDDGSRIQRSFPPATLVKTDD